MGREKPSPSLILSEKEKQEAEAMVTEERSLLLKAAKAQKTELQQQGIKARRS